MLKNARALLTCWHRVLPLSACQLRVNSVALLRTAPHLRFSCVFLRCPPFSSFLGNMEDLPPFLTWLLCSFPLFFTVFLCLVCAATFASSCFVLLLWRCVRCWCCAAAPTLICPMTPMNSSAISRNSAICLAIPSSCDVSGGWWGGCMLNPTNSEGFTTWAIGTSSLNSTSFLHKKLLW